jgi:hypothetical protein
MLLLMRWSTHDASHVGQALTRYAVERHFMYLINESQLLSRRSGSQPARLRHLAPLTVFLFVNAPIAILQAGYDFVLDQHP